MNEWSTYFQNPDFLKSTRLFTLDPEFRPLISKWIGLKNGLRILDVGCGTGAFAFYLADEVEGCDFVGLDCDSTFTAEARLLAENQQKNTFTFLEGDALALPFPDNSFDLVVSHTFLTNINNPKKALREMGRVGRPGGIVASITAQQLEHIPLHPGFYPPSHGHYYLEWLTLYKKILDLYEQVKPRADFLCGADPALVPQLFAQAKLWHISMHALGIGFSLSDAHRSDEMKKTYIQLATQAELKKFDAYSALPAFSNRLTTGEMTRFRELMALRQTALLAEVGENTIWNWIGGANILMTGVVPLL